MGTTTEIDIETMLYEMLQDDEAAPEVRRVQTYEEAGLLTRSRGVVLRMKDGTEFQVSIIKSH